MSLDVCLVKKKTRSLSSAYVEIRHLLYLQGASRSIGGRDWVENWFSRIIAILFIRETQVSPRLFPITAAGSPIYLPWENTWGGTAFGLHNRQGWSLEQTRFMASSAAGFWRFTGFDLCDTKPGAQMTRLPFGFGADRADFVKRWAERAVYGEMPRVTAADTAARSTSSCPSALFSVAPLLLYRQSRGKCTCVLQ